MVVLLILLCQREFHRLISNRGIHYYPVLAFLLAGLLPLIFYWDGRPPEGPHLFILLLLLLVGPLLHRRPLSIHDLPGIGITLLGILYTSWLLSHYILLYLLPQGRYYILFVLLVIWPGDTAAYYVGSHWGKKRLAPQISPNKTVEGALANLAAGVLGGLIGWGWFLRSWDLMSALITAILINILGQVGDLYESFIKRTVGVKDAGSLLPGHGGVLDRLDSLLFAGPAMYYCCRLLRP